MQIDQWDTQIAHDKKISDQAFATFKKFQADEARINEVDAFVKSRPQLSSVLVHLAETLPPHVAFDAIDLRDNGMMLRLAVRGTPDMASGRATAYLEQLRADAELGTRFDEFNFVSTPTRNPATGNMTVEFFFRLRGAKK